MQLPTGLGAIIAVLVLVVDVVLAAIGRPLGESEAALAIGLLALARLT